MSTNTDRLWYPVESIAIYFELSYAQVRDELQQRDLLGEIDGVLFATGEQAWLWAERSFGADAATALTDALLEYSFLYPEQDVPLVEEFDASTDGDWPYLL
ncbi:MAG: hypothetical protein ACTH30_13725 [Leucobacter sp.]